MQLRRERKVTLYSRRDLELYGGCLMGIEPTAS